MAHECSCCNGTGTFTDGSKCYYCKGSGKVECKACDGTGKVED